MQPAFPLPANSSGMQLLIASGGNALKRLNWCEQEGAGHAVMSAYVEIVFDNMDQRLPVSRCVCWQCLCALPAHGIASPVLRPLCACVSCSKSDLNLMALVTLAMHLQFDREEVRLRRTVGKGDEYTVDKKKIT